MTDHPELRNHPARPHTPADKPRVDTPDPAAAAAAEHLTTTGWFPAINQENEAA